MKKATLIRYAVTLGIGLVIALIVSFINSLYTQETVTGVMKSLSDCFAVAGFLLVLIGLLVICSNGGTFDMLGFGVKKVVGLFKTKSDDKDKEKFYEYRKRKQQNKRSFVYLIVCGAVYLVLALLFLILYYKL